MRVSVPAIVVALSALSSATFFWATDDDFAVGEPKNINWDVADFGANVDIYVGDEDADEDDEAQGKKIASDVANVGAFTWTPDDTDFSANTLTKKKKKIWGKDRKGKKNKGRKLIDIIKKPGKIKKPIETTLVPVIIPPGQQTLPGTTITLPGTTITSIGTLTRTVPGQVTATQTVSRPWSRSHSALQLTCV